MAAGGKKSVSAEWAVLAALAVVLAGSVVLMLRGGPDDARPIFSEDRKAVRPVDSELLESALRLAERDIGRTAETECLFVGGLRVAAVVSAYPIPYEAEVCPFSQVPQPSMDQLDRDGDGITDDWELRHGLDRYDAGDAAADLDGDGFSNLDEFTSATDPGNAQEHPAYAEKLRFVERKDRPFPLVFQGFMEQSDGNIMFQLNNPSTGKSHFLAIGESAEDVVVKRFEFDEGGRNHKLYVTRRGFDVELIRGESTLDPESEAELINILDQSPIMVTMGALLSLHNDEYTVLSVHPDKVILKDAASGKVYDIVGLAEGEL